MTRGRSTKPRHLPAGPVLLLAWMMATGGGSGCASSSSAPASQNGTGGSVNTAGTGGSTGYGGSSAGTGGAAVGATGGASAGTGGRTGSGSGGASATGGAGTGGSSGCQVVLTPSTDRPPVAGPTARLLYRGSIRFPGARPAVWTWQVHYMDGTVIPFLNPGGDTSMIDFPIQKAGSYVISAYADTGVICQTNLPLTVAAACPDCFTFRVTPSSLSPTSIPAQEKVVAAISTDTTIDLDAGTATSVNPQDSVGRFLSAYVRVSSPSSGVVLEGHTALGPLQPVLLPSLQYDVLVVPEDALAPQLFTGNAAQLGLLFADPGLGVSGVLHDGSGAPVANAVVVLRQGSIPSTLGVSGADGSFVLLARPGTLSVLISPPVGSGLPEARVAASPGVVLSPGGTLSLTMTWAAAPRAMLTVAVRTADGSAAVTGARVHVESAAERPSVGTMMVDPPPAGGASIVVTGSVRSDVLVDDTGLARFPGLAPGDYQVTVVPPAPSGEGSLTTMAVTVPSGGLMAVVPLARPVPLRGNLLPAPDTAGARVIARDLGPGLTAEAPSAVVGDQGQYTLAVPAGRSYQLIADPAPGQALARTVLPSVMVTAGDVVVPDAMLPPASAHTFTLTLRGGGPVAGATVQVFCSPDSESCLDPTVPVAEAVSDRAGRLTVMLAPP